MLRKLLAGVLCIVMLFSLSSCSQNSGKQDTTTQGTSDQGANDESPSGQTASDQTSTDTAVTSAAAADPAAEDPFVPTSKTITVSWFVPWWMSEEDFQYIFDGFAREYPDYTIVKNEIPDLATLMASIQAGEQPDIWMGGDPNTTNFISGCYQNLFAPLDDYLTRDPFLNTQSMDSALLDLGLFNNNHYALPYQTSEWCLLYNKKLFAEAGLDPEKPPVTFTEFYDYAKKLTKFDSNGVVQQLGVINGPYAWQLEMAEKGGSIADNGLDSTYNSQWMLDIYKYCEQFNTIVGSSNSWPKDVKFGMGEGNVAMDIGGNLTNLNDIAKSGVDFGIAKFPRPDDYDQQIVPAIQWYYFSIPKGAKNPNGGWLFAKYAMTEGLYQTIANEYQENPSYLFPQYIVHKDTRQKVYDTFLPNIDPDTADLIAARDKMMTDNAFIIRYSPIHSTLIQISAKWSGKKDNGEIGLQEQLQGIHNEYQSILKIWEQDQEAKGWQFPEGKAAIPPSNYNDPIN